MGMGNLVEIIITIICSVIASSGFWTFVTKRRDNNNAEAKMILGLGHVKIIETCEKYLDRGYIRQDEYDSLYNYLYLPYKELGGNGTAERMVNEIKKLPIRKEW